MSLIVSCPTLSVMIPTYNSGALLRQTLKSVLATTTDPSVMQIEVVDDSSTEDDPRSVVTEVGEGRVSYFRRTANGGVTKTFNTCLERARGEFVHILHGDDWVEPAFYERMLEASRHHPQAGMLFCRSLFRSENGELLALSTRFEAAERGVVFELPQQWYANRIFAPSILVRRSAYEAVGGYDEGLIHVADWDMWDRLIRHCGALHVNEALANYRMFAGNDTGKLAKSGENLRDHLRIGEKFATRHKAFNPDRFRELVVDRAETQAVQFAALGDTASSAANYELAAQTIALLPRNRRLRRTLSRLRGQTHDFLGCAIKPFRYSASRILNCITGLGDR